MSNPKRYLTQYLATRSVVLILSSSLRKTECGERRDEEVKGA
jgi:hypothetical protein